MTISKTELKLLDACTGVENSIIETVKTFDVYDLIEAGSLLVGTGHPAVLRLIRLVFTQDLIGISKIAELLNVSVEEAKEKAAEWQKSS